MSSLVARFAENLFWFGRYMERAENTARILHINQTFARDNPDGPDWRRILDLYADTERFFDLNDEADARNVLNFYVLDRGNFSSIAFAVAAARENARTVRHLISTEMWVQANHLHNAVKALTQRDIWVTNLSKTAIALTAECQTFEGVVEGTFLRDEPWCFYQLGKYLERADQTTRALDISYDNLSMSSPDAVATVQWHTLLRSVSGYHAYRLRHPASSKPSDIACFLLYDTKFPRAVALCVDRVTARLRDLEQRHQPKRVDKLEKARRSLAFALETGPGTELTSKRLHKLIDQTQVSLATVSSEIGNAYFGFAGTR